MTKIAPSILSANFGNLQADIDVLNHSEADWLHCDVMDGLFVPNISFGFPVLKHVARLSQKPLDVHLMIVNPERYIREVADLGALIMNIHAEACRDIPGTLQRIHDAGMQAAITINPETPVSVVEPFLGQVEMVLVMSVHPGFGGQAFIPGTLDKVRALRRMIDQVKPGVLIEVDGGVNLETGRQLVEAGTDVLVAGSTVFHAPDMPAMVSRLKRLGD